MRATVSHQSVLLLRCSPRARYHLQSYPLHLALTRLLSPGGGSQPHICANVRPICSSWNTGTCKFPGKCFCVRVCTGCYGNHPASVRRNRTAPTMSPKQHLCTPNQVQTIHIKWKIRTPNSTVACCVGGISD